MREFKMRAFHNEVAEAAAREANAVAEAAEAASKAKYKKFADKLLEIMANMEGAA